MGTTERDRRHVHTQLETALGPKAADTLMELMPRYESHQLATRDDVHATTVMLRGEMAELRGEMAELRGEVTAQFGEFKAWVMRWGTGVIAANTVAMVTALLT